MNSGLDDIDAAFKGKVKHLVLEYWSIPEEMQHTT